MTSIFGVDPTSSITHATQPSDWNSKRLSWRTSVAREETSGSIQVYFMKRKRSLRYNDFIHICRTLRGVDRCNLFSVTMVGRRVNSFRCWSTGKPDFLLPERGWTFAGLQIPSMGYPPSSTVGHFKKIFSISNLNDWLIADGVFYVIRCIILLIM